MTRRVRLPYTQILLQDAEHGYTAEVLELPGCYAEGKTAHQALRALERAMRAWIDAAQAQGQALPTPLCVQEYAGKVALRLPRSMHRQAVLYAARDGISLNQLIVSALAARLAA